MKNVDVHRVSMMVRGYELDSYGHVNNAVYLQYFEQARWEFFRDHDLLSRMTQDHLFLVVVDTHIRYMKELILFDQITVETKYKVEKPFLIFSQKIHHLTSNLPVARATVKTVFVDSQRVPQDIPEYMLSI